LMRELDAPDEARPSRPRVRIADVVVAEAI